VSELAALLTVQDVAELLGVSRATVYGLVKNGDLQPVKLPLRKTRFREEDIAALIAA
jgi:excisionase family DNA binding protein